MTESSPIHVQPGARTLGSGYLFGVPIGNMGWFGSLLIGVGTGFIAFFATTFFAIFFILIYNTATHGNVDFALSYRRFGFPTGIVVMVLALAYLGMLWLKRILRSS